MNAATIVAVVIVSLCIITTAVGIVLTVYLTQRENHWPWSSNNNRRQRRQRRAQHRLEADREEAKACADIALLPLDDVLARLRGTRAAANYMYACQYREEHPIDESEGRLSDHDHERVLEEGARAWAFAPGPEHSGIAVRSGTEIEFSGGEQSLLASLQFPNERRVYYYEVRLDSVPAATNVAVGVAMRNYPPRRMAGWARNSVAYHTIDGTAYYSHPLDARRTALARARTSDTIGVGWRPNSGKMFFALNGAFICHIRTPWARRRLFPVVSADGPCSLSFNAGERAFVLSHANMRHWSLASTEGVRMPPPMYQHVAGTFLLEESPRHLHGPPAYGGSNASLASPSPSYSVLSVDGSLDVQHRHRLPGDIFDDDDGDGDWCGLSDA
ncbi:Protein ssh4, partial [Coemansia nantahalensis]